MNELNCFIKEIVIGRWMNEWRKNYKWKEERFNFKKLQNKNGYYLRKNYKSIKEWIKRMGNWMDESTEYTVDTIIPE